jgi:DNA-directed RNA polymerase specialized sigma24 family protein
MDSDPTPDDAPDGAPAEAPAAMSREEQRFAMMRDLEALVERYQEEFDLRALTPSDKMPY